MKRETIWSTCPRCDTPVLATQWDFTHLMPTHKTRQADPVSITTTTETACIILARPTYGLYTRAGTQHITLRDPEWHRRHYHGTPDHVLPAHLCGTTLPGQPLTPPPEPAAPHDPNQLQLEPETIPF